MNAPAFGLDSQIIDGVEAGLIVLNAEGTVLRFNEWVAAASGRSSAQALGRPLAEVFPGLANDRLTIAIESAFRSGTSTLLTHVINGTIFPLATRGRDVLVHDVMVSGIASAGEGRCLIHIVDVTAFARKEKFLRARQNARYNAVVESALDVILTMDDNAKVLFANPAALTQFGYAAEDLVGRNAADLFHDPAAWAAIWRDIIAGDVLRHSQELMAIRKDGSRSHLEVLGSRWQTDSRVFVTAILRDVNEKREIHNALAALNATLEDKVAERTASLMNAEGALRQVQKMEAVGQLTGGIAHDFNNLLQGISGALQIARKRISSGRFDEVNRFIAEALMSTTRAASLTQRLLTFSRQRPIDPHPTDANELIASVAELIRRAIGLHVKMIVAGAEGLWPVLCDAHQLENALLNLAINGRDAMPGGGALTITTANRTLAGDVAQARQLPPGDYVCIAVGDSGTGMSQATLTKAFEPFFTTKAVGKGTGLGLSMVYGFARQANGSARIESEEGAGTTIEIYLPRFVGEIVPVLPAVEPEEPRAAATTGTALVVEDEGIVRLLAVEVLNDLGYQVVQAANGAAAEKLLLSTQPIDLLISDIGLPDVDGIELVKKARALRPDISVLLMTGYADDRTTEALGAGIEMILKPFGMEALAARVHQLTGPRRVS